MFKKKKKKQDVEITANPLITILIETNPNSIQTGVASSIGRRNYQQDAVKVEKDYAYADNNEMIAILCDGMGGLSGGEIASNLCVDTLYQDFHKADVSNNVTGFLQSSIDRLDEAVASLKTPDHKPLHAGTTLACTIIIDNMLYWASVGDSRIYILRGDEMVRATVDHNYQMILDQKVEKGVMTTEEAQFHPKREALVSYIGMGGVKYIDMNVKPLQLKHEDYIVICSDGLYRSISENEIKETIQGQQGNATDKANALVSLAINKQRKNQDNTTVIVIKFVDTDTKGINTLGYCANIDK